MPSSPLLENEWPDFCANVPLLIGGVIEQVVTPVETGDFSSTLTGTVPPIEYVIHRADIIGAKMAEERVDIIHAPWKTWDFNSCSWQEPTTEQAKRAQSLQMERKTCGLIMMYPTVIVLPNPFFAFNSQISFFPKGVEVPPPKTLLEMHQQDIDSALAWNQLMGIMGWAPLFEIETSRPNRPLLPPHNPA